MTLNKEIALDNPNPWNFASSEARVVRLGRNREDSKQESEHGELNPYCEDWNPWPLSPLLSLGIQICIKKIRILLSEQTF